MTCQREAAGEIEDPMGGGKKKKEGVIRKGRWMRNEFWRVSPKKILWPHSCPRPAVWQGRREVLGC